MTHFSRALSALTTALVLAAGVVGPVQAQSVVNVYGPGGRPQRCRRLPRRLAPQTTSP